MTLDDAQAILARVTYKAGSTFSLTLNKYDCKIRLGLHQPIKDTQPSAMGGETLTIGWIISLHHIQTEQQFLFLVKEVVQRWEFHESMEWLKIDGQLIYNPHSMI